MTRILTSITRSWPTMAREPSNDDRGPANDKRGRSTMMRGPANNKRGRPMKRTIPISNFKECSLDIEHLFPGRRLQIGYQLSQIRNPKSLKLHGQAKIPFNTKYWGQMFGKYWGGFRLKNYYFLIKRSLKFSFKSYVLHNMK